MEQKRNTQVYNPPITQPRHQAEAWYKVQPVDTWDRSAVLLRTLTSSMCESRARGHTLNTRGAFWNACATENKKNIDSNDKQYINMLIFTERWIHFSLIPKIFQRPLRYQFDNRCYIHRSYYHFTSIAFNLNLKITFP